MNLHILLSAASAAAFVTLSLSPLNPAVATASAVTSDALVAFSAPAARPQKPKPIAGDLATA